MELNEKIFALRKKAGMSQEELANEMDVSRQTVYKWESGDIQPEIIKIKKLAKFFSVSFDYLMDDSIESEEQKKDAIIIKKREIITTNAKVSLNHADIDNGYAEKRKIKLKPGNYLVERRAVVENTLKKVGATEIFFIHPNATIAYFYDNVKKVMGFYYDGQIQFVCPIENVVGFQFWEEGQRLSNCTANAVGVGVGAIGGVGFGSVPTVAVEQGTTAEAILSYKAGGEVKELKLDFTVNNSFLLGVIKEAGDLENLWSSFMSMLTRNLSRLQNMILNLQVVANEILSGKCEVEQINKDLYIESNKQSKKEYSEYVEKINIKAKKDTKKHHIGNAILWTLLLGFIIGPALFLIIMAIPYM